MRIVRLTQTARTLGAALILLPLLLGIIVVSTTRQTNAQDATGDAAVRIVHGSSDAGAVDIYLDGELIVEGREFATATDPAFVSEGEHGVQIVPTGGALEDAVIDDTVDLAAGVAYTVAAIGSADDLQLSVAEVDLANIADGQTRLRVIHGSPDAGTLDITVVDGDSIVSNLEFANVGPYVDLDEGVYSLAVSEVGSDSPALTAEDLTLEAGTVYDVLLIGAAADETLQALIVANVPEEQQVSGNPVEIRTGDCDAPGDIVQTFNSLTVPAGDALGQADLAAIASSSYTLADVSLDDILADNHVIVVHLSEEDAGAIIACGEIGGPLTENGNLAIGLREQGDSGYVGIAYLETGADATDETGVYVFLASDLTGGAGATAIEDLPAASPEAEA